MHDGCITVRIGLNVYIQSIHTSPKQYPKFMKFLQAPNSTKPRE
jgi:hypothetical protein